MPRCVPCSPRSFVAATDGGVTQIVGGTTKAFVSASRPRRTRGFLFLCRFATDAAASGGGQASQSRGGSAAMSAPAKTQPGATDPATRPVPKAEKKQRERVFSGIQPSGTPHIGNY